MSPTAKRLVAAWGGWVWNCGLTHVPSRHLRRWVLSCWLEELGRGASVQMGVRFLHGPRVKLGARSVLNFGCLLDGRKYSIDIGEDASIGPCATILTLGHDPQSPDFADRGGAVRVGDRVWIGYGAIILPGVEVGTGAVVGAGAVVTKPVPEYSIVVGNPARQIGTRERGLRYRLGYSPFLL